ncbi:hypothetical protein [Nannocystis punicea]|uniref:Uncharacterized protein n=1 Tax=Nannocystis punicea TaxID=2995304 RepID=A0ABY7HJY2_9BACT|nr:hypothetical protein [Nannocystis poenicansa]WAS99350.1 hypothetical protein O0S08_24750 [Nannocystis poenicansa]
MSRARQRAEFARLVEVLSSVGWHDDERSVVAWVERLRELPDGEGLQLARRLLRAYRHGALSPERWAELAGEPPRIASDVDDAVRRLWDAFAAAGFVQPYRTEENCGRVRAGLARRWAWQPRWYLMSQDEDLLLMSDELVPTLLATAAERRVPKRQVLVDIVAHHARDSCWQAAYHGEGLEARLRRAAGWAPQAREIGAPELAAYLERLGGHAVAGPVDREGAEQRLLDLGRCVEPPRSALCLRAVEGGWEGWLVNSALNRRLRIDAATGRMTPIEAKRRR